MSTLAPLHAQLHALGSQRRGARWLRAMAAFGIACWGLLSAWFAIDWLCALGKSERIGMLVLAGLGLIYVVRKQVLPWLVRRENEIELALLVERSAQIDTDLVAALQLESPAHRYGSSMALADAVVAHGSELSTQIDWQQTVRESVHRRPLKWLVVLSVLVALLGICYPGHLQVFVNRLLLGNRHYPSQTFIAEVRVGEVLVRLGDDDPAPIRAPYGQPLVFQVQASGVLPDRGEIQISSFEATAPAVIELVRHADQAGLYTGQLPRLVEKVRFQLFLGDDWIEPQTIHAIPLPVVNLHATAEPPEYARSATAESSADGDPRQLAVLEGSRVTIGIECRNKQLASAQLTIGGQSYSFRQLDDTKRIWQLPSDGTPLARIADAVRYTLEVVDVDGLKLPEPIEGLVRIKTDRPPRVTAAIVTQHVLPNGKPRVAFGAVDDFGVAALRLAYVVSREDGTTSEGEQEIPLDGVKPLVQGRYSFELAPLQLKKGDQVRITLEARDHRGDNPGKVASSDSLVLTVTDERGVLAAMTETDERTARQMDLIIQRQLGLGEGP